MRICVCTHTRVCVLALSSPTKRIKQNKLDPLFPGREAVSVGSEVEILMSSPANRWSQEMLTRRPQALINNFEVKAIQAYLRACGCSGELARPTRFKGNDVFHSIRIIT